jgi:hypothetical protein
VPISGAVEAGGKVCVAFSKAFVKDSPNIDTDGTLNVEDEQRLYRHYGMRYATLTPGASGPPAEEPKMSGRRRLRRRHEKVGNDIDLRSQSDEKASST